MHVNECRNIGVRHRCQVVLLRKVLQCLGGRRDGKIVMIVAMIWYRPFSRPDFGFDDCGSAPNGFGDDLVHHVI
ncbi:hypothetical protein, partial [Acidithiobacillus sp.]|uniref:hypothetical protein n=1 Tax=Acidithiobacillus sp. TaxID=1872118 RepID=UPI0035650D7B